MRYLQAPAKSADSADAGIDPPAIRDLILGVVGVALGVSPADILSPSRRPLAVYARHLAMYLLHTSFRLKHSLVGRAFGRDRTTAAYACKNIEDLRDDPTVETLLGACEASLEALRSLASDPAPMPRRRRLVALTDAEGTVR